MLTPSLETVSEFHPFHPPMMTMLVLFQAQQLDSTLFSESVKGSLTQPPFCALHFTHHILVGGLNPPHTMLPDWTCLYLQSGSQGSWHEVLFQGRYTSAVCPAPYPPVIRMATEIETK